jgi:hypothetical protein
MSMAFNRNTIYSFFGNGVLALRLCHQIRHIGIAPGDPALLQRIEPLI